jgi:L-threonylcarbamoyladenylate synthase
MPKLEWLQNLLQKSGPLVAPSANFEGEVPSSTTEMAETYFSSQVDFYLDNNKLNNPPSTVIKLTNSGYEIVRPGAFDITKI